MEEILCVCSVRYHLYAILVSTVAVGYEVDCFTAYFDFIIIIIISRCVPFLYSNCIFTYFPQSVMMTVTLSVCLYVCVVYLVIIRILRMRRGREMV